MTRLDASVLAKQWQWGRMMTSVLYENISYISLGQTREFSCIHRHFSSTLCVRLIRWIDGSNKQQQKNWSKDNDVKVLIQQRHILLIIILFLLLCARTCMIMYEPISDLRLLPSHRTHSTAVQKYFFYQYQPVSLDGSGSIGTYCVWGNVNKIPVLSHNTITTRAENRERISFMMRALLCICM